VTEECFCGCGVSVPRFPLRMRSMNTRERLMVERLVWYQAIFGTQPVTDNLDQWASDGWRMIRGELMPAMHGEIDLRSIDSKPSAQWLKYGRGIDRVAQANGFPTLNRWLKQNPEAVREWWEDPDLGRRQIVERWGPIPQHLLDSIDEEDFGEEEEEDR
jgi:hypothetical protein